MIDSSTGRILFPLPDLWVEPSLSREAFLASAVGKDCPVMVRNEPWCSFRLPTARFEDHAFGWGIYFRGSALVMVSIGGIAPGGPAEDPERARKRFHDSALKRALGEDWEQRTFPWGGVSSSYDPKSDSSSITVSYPAPEAAAPSRGCLLSFFDF